MKISLKTFLILAPFIFLISCSDISNKDESAVTWDATNYIFYNEFMECTPGEDYSRETLDQMVADWRNLGLSENLAGAWGYASASENNTLQNGEWELSWTSKEAADAAWEEWVVNEEAQAWSEKYSSVLQCDGENRRGYSFIFYYDPYAFGPSPENGSFTANFVPCTLNDGKTSEDFGNAIHKYNSWLDGLDETQVTGFYAYGVYLPEDQTSEVDYWFGNFHNNMEGMETGNDLWEQSGGDAKDALEAVGTCTNPEIFQGLVFYDPTKPDFS